MRGVDDPTRYKVVRLLDEVALQIRTSTPKLRRPRS